jgi:hypothetical protein
MAQQLYAEDYAPTTVWALDATLPAGCASPLPAVADVVIVGAGYTGLSAARETAAAGRSTVVLDAGPIGGGCSSRNGGQVAFSIKPDYQTLERRYGAMRAAALYEEGAAAVGALDELVRHEGLACDWRESGCFIGAHTPRQYGALQRLADEHRRRLSAPVEVVSRARQHAEIDTDFYHGGAVFPADYSVHPIKLLNALHARAVSKGAKVYAHCEVLSFRRESHGFDVYTTQGLVKARQVLLATNGYTGALSPWHRRRVIPVGSYQIATELLEPSFVQSMIPKARNIGDTRHVVMYARPTPDGRRIVFGGRASAAEQDLTRVVPRLVGMMQQVFPQLTGVRISRAWMGFVGFTFDELPHIGSMNELFYCMGYCGQGIPLSVYYGRQVGLKMLKRAGSTTALDGLAFPTRPFYGGFPWFLPAAVHIYRLRDRFGW